VEKKVNESDGYCAALPYFLYGYGFNNIKKIIASITVSKISLKYALTKFHLIDMALKGSKDPIKEFTRKFKKNMYFRNVIKDIEKIKRLKTKPHPLMVKKLGMACSYPGTFNSSIHSIINSVTYKDAILKTIKAGGCNCSRVNFIGAYFAALKGVNSIPRSWIRKTVSAKKILNQK
jgi:ADP-ribosylglycohydrolase